jgi:hypothetical protein
MCEHEQVNMIEYFWNISLTHGTKYCMAWRGHVSNDGKNKWMEKKWKTKIDERVKWTKKIMNTTYSQPRILCQSKLYFFITKRYVWTKNITCSSPRHMFPFGIETLWNSTFSIPFQLVFIWIQSFKPFMSRSILAIWRIKWMKFFLNWKTRWTKHVPNQKLCVNPNFTCSQLRGMCKPKHHMFIEPKIMFPSWIETIWSCTFFIPFQLVFLF